MCVGFDVFVFLVVFFSRLVFAVTTVNDVLLIRYLSDVLNRQTASHTSIGHTKSVCNDNIIFLSRLFHVFFMLFNI